MRALAVGVALLLAGCPAKECPNAPEPRVPMTEARAKALAPDARQGVGASLTEVRGDCRPKDDPPTACPSLDCVRDRAPLPVYVLRLGQSVALDPDCDDAPSLATLAELAAAIGQGNGDGELAIGLEEGDYDVYLGVDARCGSSTGDTGRLRIATDRWVVRDFVLDLAQH